ncbi:MAG: ABC transporter ATP-binding protein [Caulobacter sp.]
MSEPTATPAPRPTNSWALIGRLYKESLHRHLALLIVSFACMAVIAGMASAYTYLMGPLVDRVFIAKDGRLLWLIGGAVVGIFVLRSMASYVQSGLLTAFGQNIVLDLQKKLWGRLLYQDLGNSQAVPSGALVGVFTYDVSLLRTIVCNLFLRVGKDLMTIGGMIGLMFYTDWKMALFSIMAAPLSILPLIYLGRRVREASSKAQGMIGNLSASLTQALGGVRLVHAYRLEAVVEEQVRRQADLAAEHLITTTKVQAAILPVFDGLGGLAIAGIMIYGGGLVVGQAMTPGSFLVFVGAVYGAYQPLRSLARVNIDLQTGLAAAERVFALMDREPLVRVSPTASTLPRLSGSVAFEDVRFSYGAGGEEVLKGVSFTAPAGQVTALVGPTGAGKSTLFNLIARFHDPDQGRVLVNGADVREVSLGSLRDNIALVSQDVALFDGTIADNIRHGRLDATDAEVEAAALAAGVQDFAAQTPLGLRTRLGENGLGLSGGQRQRISIARALLRDAPILLLDEATSAQDPASERQIQHAIDQLTRGRTTIVIAHRLATIRNAHRIHVIDGGQVVESGSHDDMVDEDGPYAQLLNLQRPRERPAARATQDSL